MLKLPISSVMHGTLTSILTIIVGLMISYNAVAQSEDIVPRQPPPSKSNEFSIRSPSLSWNPSMVAVIICLISAFCVIGCVFVYLRKCSEQRFINDLVTDDDDVDINNNGSRSRRRRLRRHRRATIVRGLDPTVIDTFPMFLYSDVKDLKLGNNKGSLECAVCLNEFEDDETLRLLPQCSHVFHPDCIDAWLASHVTCPVCRADLMIITTALSRDSLSHHLWSQPQGLPHHEVISSSSSSSFFLRNIDAELISSTPASRTTTPESSTPRIIVDEKYRNRSHSMGHLLLVRPVEDCERFTLRLPEEVKSQLMKSELSRARSCVVLPRVKSSRNVGGYRSRSSSSSNYYEREVRSSDRWRGFTVAAPPFFSRGSSTRSFSSSSKNVEVELEEKTVSTRNNFLFKSVKSPFDRLFGHAAEKEDNGGERSFNRLTGESSV